LPCILKDTKNQTLNKTIDRNYKKFVKLNISCAIGTLCIANRAFGGLRKFSAIYKHRQIVDLAFKNE